MYQIRRALLISNDVVVFRCDEEHPRASHGRDAARLHRPVRLEAPHRRPRPDAPASENDEAMRKAPADVLSNLC